MSETRKLAAILVADVVGYSRLAGADEDRILARLTRNISASPKACARRACRRTNRRRIEALRQRAIGFDIRLFVATIST
jgi:class 3 adenylate cyclase